MDKAIEKHGEHSNWGGSMDSMENKSLQSFTEYGYALDWASFIEYG